MSKKEIPKVYEEDVVILKNPQKEEKSLIGFVSHVYDSENEDFDSDLDEELDHGEILVF